MQLQQLLQNNSTVKVAAAADPSHASSLRIGPQSRHKPRDGAGIDSLYTPNILW